MTVRPLAVALVATLSLAGCSGADEPAATAPSAAAGSSASPGAAPTSPASGTPAGTELEPGDDAEVTWKVDAATTGAVDLVVRDVRRRPARALAGWVPQDALAGTVPYFVRVRVTNTGGGDLAGAALPLYLRDADGVLGPPATFEGDFAACPSRPLPEPFAAGDEADLCLVFTLARSARPDAVTFQPTSDRPGVSWALGRP